jgi:hypothetical protein
MANVSYDAFLDKILPYARNCPDPVIEGAVRDTVIEICEKTGIWQTQLDPISAVADQYEYDLEPPADALVHSIVNVLDENGDQLTSVTGPMLDQRYPDWRNKPSRAKFFVRKENTLIWFAPAPSVARANAFLVTVQLKPTLSSSSADGWVMTDFRDAIINGAISRITQMPDRDWSNFKTSAVMFAKFENQLIDIEKKARQANEGAVAIMSYGGIGPAAPPRRRYESRRSRYI